MVLWQLPAPVVGSTHAFKYRLLYGYPGRRIIGYDNERSKAERLMDDFLADVARERGEGA